MYSDALAEGNEARRLDALTPHPDWKLEVHIDTDEATACDLERATKVELLKS